MVKHRIYNSTNTMGSIERDFILTFLFEHLEQFGDARNDIDKSIKYAMQEETSFGGFVACALDDNELVGVVVVNRTGMKGYIPENILVYIATHKLRRGMGIGKELMRKAVEEADGDVALHVEPENPAVFLYKKLGFESKYIEMRYKKKTV